MSDIAIPNTHPLIPLSELEADSNLGGKLTVQDVGIPLLQILQSMSPQVNPDNPRYIEGAMSGMLYISIMEKVYDGRNEGLELVLCNYERMYVMWRQREQGGGFAGTFPTDDPITKEAKPNERGVLTLPNGFTLVDTAYHSMLVRLPDTGNWVSVIMPLKSTQLKASRKVNNIILSSIMSESQKPYPRFYWRWKLTTFKEQKDNYTWSGPRFERIGSIVEVNNGKDLYGRAKEFALLAAKGVIIRKAAEAEATEEAEEDEKVPF